jgi:hypothetical protein
VLTEAKSLQMSADRFQSYLLTGCEGSDR